MMQIKVTAPAKIHTTIQLPSSKSISNRALISGRKALQKPMNEGV